jgi:hypothetical protein
MRSLGVKTLLALLCAASTASASDQIPLLLAGRVGEVDAEAQEIVIHTESGIKTISYTEDTKVIGLRSASTVESIRPEDKVVVLYTEDGTEKQSREIKDVGPSHEIETLEGNVVHVYELTRSMFIESSDGWEDVFQIADNAIMILNGQLVNVAELAVAEGERVTVYYTTDLTLKTVQAIGGPPIQEIVKLESRH